MKHISFRLQNKMFHNNLWVDKWPTIFKRPYITYFERKNSRPDISTLTAYEITPITILKLVFHQTEHEEVHICIIMLNTVGHGSYYHANSQLYLLLMIPIFLYKSPVYLPFAYKLFDEFSGKGRMEYSSKKYANINSGTLKTLSGLLHFSEKGIKKFVRSNLAIFNPLSQFVPFPTFQEGPLPFSTFYVHFSRYNKTDYFK